MGGGVKFCKVWHTQDTYMTHQKAENNRGNGITRPRLFHILLMASISFWNSKWVYTTSVTDPPLCPTIFLIILWFIDALSATYYLGKDNWKQKKENYFFFLVRGFFFLQKKENSFLLSYVLINNTVDHWAVQSRTPALLFILSLVLLLYSIETYLSNISNSLQNDFKLIFLKK